MPAPRIDPKRAKKYITATQLRERWGVPPVAHNG